ncbi:MAG: hypothetical protein B6D71_06765 [gamma proteobacterium symbiont of Stewartia floridana]|nr:MAG: hypothetical protein B6D71_06765 [gamma proteobacterium symbiont of Stewartia floridana]
MQIDPRFTDGRILITDIHATNESLVTIDNHQLTVISIVQGELAIQRIDWEKAFDASPGLLQRLKESVFDCTRAHIVNQQSDFNPSLGSAHKGVQNSLSGAVRLPDVVIEVDMLSCLVDRLLQIVEQQLTGSEDLDPVTGQRAIAIELPSQVD